MSQKQGGCSHRGSAATISVSERWRRRQRIAIILRVPQGGIFYHLRGNRNVRIAEPLTVFHS